MFLFGKQKCAQCGMELGDKFYEWKGKKFCCEECKKAYIMKNKKGESKCH